MARAPPAMTLSMRKSLSTGALKAAAELKLSHMPKRATQHGVFLPSYEVLPPPLKEGQEGVQRHMYMDEAPMLKDTYIAVDMPETSEYSRTLGSQTRPLDYKNPVKPMRPGEPAEGGGHHNVAHWGSTYKSSHNSDAVHGAVQHRQNGPSYQAVNPPTCVGGVAAYSAYTEDFGRRGSNPNQRMVRGQASMPVLKTVLTLGTPKATKHIPGYQGFLPTNTSNPYVARVEAGHDLRSVDKTNLTHTFHQNVPYYAGHLPSNPLNDSGPVRQSTMTSTGRTFRKPVGAE